MTLRGRSPSINLWGSFDFPSRRILSFYEIEVFIWKFEHEAIYICLVGGVVIFDESWAGKGIDSRVNTVHYPVFIDAEVNPAANLTYSEHRLDDIHGNTSEEPFEGSIFYLGDWELNSWYNFLCEDMLCSSMPA